MLPYITYMDPMGDNHPHFVLEYVPSTFDEISMVYTGNMYRHMTEI